MRCKLGCFVVGGQLVMGDHLCLPVGAGLPAEVGISAADRATSSVHALLQPLVVDEREQPASEVLERFKADKEARDAWTLEVRPAWVFLLCRWRMMCRWGLKLLYITHREGKLARMARQGALSLRHSRQGWPGPCLLHSQLQFSPSG